MNRISMDLLSLGLRSMLCLAAGALAQDMRANVQRSLFADPKATHIGDAIMVLVVETSSASNDASTSSDRESNLSLNVSGKTDLQSPRSGVGRRDGEFVQRNGSHLDQRFGACQTERACRFRPAERRPADHRAPVDHGDGEKQNITLSGIVRPSDIQADNSVFFVQHCARR